MRIHRRRPDSRGVSPLLHLVQGHAPGCARCRPATSPPMPACWAALARLSSNSKRVRRLAEGIESKFVPFAWGFGAALLVAQLVIANGSWFLTDWDAGALVHGAVYGIQDNFEYFSTYPNQLFLTSLFEMIAHITPNATYEGVYFELVVGSCLSLSLSTVIVAFIARKLGGARAALLAFFSRPRCSDFPRGCSFRTPTPTAWLRR